MIRHSARGNLLPISSAPLPASCGSSMGTRSAPESAVLKDAVCTHRPGTPLHPESIANGGGRLATPAGCHLYTSSPTGRGAITDNAAWFSAGEEVFTTQCRKQRMHEAGADSDGTGIVKSSNHERIFASIGFAARTGRS